MSNIFKHLSYKQSISHPNQAIFRILLPVFGIALVGFHLERIGSALPKLILGLITDIQKGFITIYLELHVFVLNIFSKRASRF